MTAEREAMTLEGTLQEARDLLLGFQSRIGPLRPDDKNDAALWDRIHNNIMALANLSRDAEPVGFVLRDTAPPYDYYWDSFVLGEPQEDETDELQWAPLYAAPTAGTRPIAWTRIEDIKDDEGRAIGTDEPRIVWGAECPDYEEGWSPLYAGPIHPPEPARDAKDAARYRWLKEHDNADLLAEDVIDEAIAAMAQESGNGR